MTTDSRNTEGTVGGGRRSSTSEPSIVPASHYSNFAFLLIALLTSSLFVGCSRLPVLEDFSGVNYTFMNQDSARVSFPSAYKGKIVVMSFIYTHCPDICPLTTNNMQHLQDTLITDKLNGVKFVTMTFDPHRDTPPVLKEYAEIRGIKFADWDFLSGSDANTDSVTYAVGVRCFPNDSTYSKDGHLSYYITHTDKCVLIDREGRVRGEYSGSQLDFRKIVNDIKLLE
jgi:protein SCO1